MTTVKFILVTDYACATLEIYLVEWILHDNSWCMDSSLTIIERMFTVTIMKQRTGNPQTKAKRTNNKIIFEVDKKWPLLRGSKSNDEGQNII